MHLGLSDGPFVPHNLISTQEIPVPLLQSQMAPRLKILMSSGSKKGTRIFFFLSLKKSRKKKPLQVPQQGPLWRDTRLQGIFTSLLIYPLLSFSQRLYERGARPCSPHSGALLKQMPFSNRYLTYL